MNSTRDRLSLLDMSLASILSYQKCSLLYGAGTNDYLAMNLSIFFQLTETTLSIKCQKMARNVHHKRHNLHIILY